MQELKLAAQLRTETGKGFNRRLREEGNIPSIVYGNSKEPVSLSINRREIVYHLQHHSNYDNIIFDLEILKDGQQQKRQTIIKELQLEPITNRLLHIDFFEIAMDKPVVLNAHILFTGESIGAKLDGGIVEYLMREVEIECLPSNIPEYIEVNISSLKIGDSINVGDLVVIPGVKVLDEPNKMVVSVLLPVKEKTAEELASEAAARPAEPEVIKKGGKEEEVGKEK
ncbi:MAG: 50S ribosomal protein L25 [bacterium]